MSAYRLVPLSPWLMPVNVLFVALLFAACRSNDQAGLPTSAEAVEIHVRWEIDNTFPASITIHEPPPGQALYEVRQYPAGAAPVVGEEIEGGIMRADHGEPRRFIARLHNESDADVRFWVAPHLPVPHVSEQGLMMSCLCTGEVYEVPAGGTWTRVMEFGVKRRAGLEGPIALTHVIVRGELTTPTPSPIGALR